jgi:hypothetical protein
VVKKFQKIHHEDTSYNTKKKARKAAEEALKTAEGFMLFTAQKDGQLIKYKGNAFITVDHAAGMPAFINQVMDQRKDQFDGR